MCRIDRVLTLPLQMHSFYGTHGDMSMSADSTCQGLQSPTLGVISMKFTKGGFVYGDNVYETYVSRH